MIMAAARYPEAQRRVQEELDMVFGKDRSTSRRFDRRFDGHECLTTSHQCLPVKIASCFLRFARLYWKRSVGDR